MTDSRQIVQPPDVLLQDLEGEAVLLNLDNGQYYGLDENSYHIYKALLSADSFQAAFEALSQEYDVAPGQLRADLAGFLAHLLENGLLAYASEQAAKS